MARRKAAAGYYVILPDLFYRFGLIRFGSRVDVYLPPGQAALVSAGQTAVAGETVLADLASDEPERVSRRS